MSYTISLSNDPIKRAAGRLSVLPEGRGVSELESELRELGFWTTATATEVYILRNGAN